MRLTRRNSRHSNCIALFPKFISNESAQMSDPSKLAFKSSPISLCDSIPVPVDFSIKPMLDCAGAICSKEQTPDCISSPLTTDSSETPLLSAWLSSETSIEPSFLIDKFSNSGSIPSAPAYTAITPTTKKLMKKKYKPIALKVRPVLTELPNKLHIIRNIIGDSLVGLLILDPNPVLFKPCGCYTEERKEIFNKNNTGFLLKEERKLLHYFMMLYQDAFAWNDTEQGFLSSH